MCKNKISYVGQVRSGQVFALIRTIALLSKLVCIAS